MIKTIVTMIDSTMAGSKTYCIMGLAMGMMVCQAFGYHQFSSETWGMVGIGGATTWKMGMDRVKK